jgi:hypothetical protein
VRSGGRDLLLVLGVAWIARAVFVLAIGEAHSVDVEYWRTALATLDEGRNPYETGVLNWPPLWLVVIKAVDAAADLVGVGFWSALRIYLVLVESAVVVTLYVTLVSSGADRAAVRRALLIGIALNPVAIILVCQHGNSDVQIGLFVTLAVAALAAHHRSRDVVAWLGGCLFLGLGVLAKTVPLVLAPLLAPGARRVSSGGRALGVVLFLGPAALGTAVILVLAPGAVWHNVITYRSTRGYFGLAGMVREFAGFDVRFTNVTLVAVAVVAAVAIVWRVTLAVALAASGAFVVLWRTETQPGAPWLFLAAAVGLMVVVAFGPGYGPQYAYWFLPALVASYVLLDDGWRRLLRVAWLVAALTYAVEYAVVDYLGAGASRVFGSGTWTADVGDYLKEPDHLVVYRLPLFVVYLVLIAAGIDRLTRRAEPATPAEVLRSPSAAAV